MLFSRQKRLQRDRDAGLVFCWRGGLEGNRGGFILALLITLGIFAIAFWGVSIDFKTSKPQQRKFAKILLLDDLSSEMALWVDQNSPFPSRWDPKNDKTHQERVEDALNSVFQEITVPPSPWREKPDVEYALVSPKLIEPGVVDLGGLPTPLVTESKPRVTALVVTLEALGALAKREPKSISPIGMEVPQQAYGSGYRFMVTIDAAGDVVYCVPVQWQEGVFIKEVENWLRLQKFLPVKGAELEVGEVSIAVEVKNHAGN